MAESKSAIPILFFLAVAAAFGLVLVVGMRNGQHANTLHPEAPALRAEIDRASRPDRGRDGDGRERVEIYYSAKLGSLLVLLRMENRQAGGLVMKITALEMGQLTALLDRSYERTCFVADELYWARVINRDGYMLLGAAIWVAAATVALAPLLAALAFTAKLLRKAGYGDVADRVEDEVGLWRTGGGYDG